jgi:hypothetical protein
MNNREHFGKVHCTVTSSTPNNESEKEMDSQIRHNSGNSKNICTPRTITNMYTNTCHNSNKLLK